MKRFFTSIVMLVMLTSLFAQEPIRVSDIKSDSSVLYGKFVFRMKAIEGNGLSSGLMLYKSNSESSDMSREQMMLQVPGENNGTTVASTVITDDASGHILVEPMTYSFSSSLAADYHTYTLKWTPDTIEWYVDSIMIRQKTSGTIDSLDSPQKIYMQASTSCGAPGGPIDLSSLPQYLHLDWMEYYTYNDGEFSLAWRDDFDEFNAVRWTEEDRTTDCDTKFTPDNITVEDGELVLSITDPNEYDEPSGVNSIEEDNREVIIVPNSHEIRMNLSEGGYHSIQVINIQGSLMMSETKYGESFSVPVAGLKAGIYFVRVRSDNRVITRKVFIPE